MKQEQRDITEDKAKQVHVVWQEKGYIYLPKDLSSRTGELAALVAQLDATSVTGHFKLVKAYQKFLGCIKGRPWTANLKMNGTDLT